MTGKQIPGAGLSLFFSMIIGNAVTFIVLFTIVTMFDGYAEKAKFYTIFTYELFQNLPLKYTVIPAPIANSAIALTINCINLNLKKNL